MSYELLLDTTNPNMKSNKVKIFNSNINNNNNFYNKTTSKQFGCDQIVISIVFVNVVVLVLIVVHVPLVFVVDFVNVIVRVPIVVAVHIFIFFVLVEVDEPCG